jgi:hypothetical protein
MPQPPQQVKISAYLFFGICLLCLCMSCSLGFVWVGTLQGMGQTMDPNAGLSLGFITCLYTIFMFAYGVKYSHCLQPLLRQFYDLVAVNGRRI